MARPSSGTITPDDLPRKYDRELHANEFLLLAYYIAAINIETAYHDAIGATTAESYTPFDGIVLTDTFEQSEHSNPMDHALFPHNNRRIERQKGLDIRVILGNPPWSATDNREYVTVDQRVKETYADTSSATLREALYDPYVKAIRQASDRILGSDKGGIVAFVTNGGFIDAKSFDGFRKAIAKEFDAIYCYNLRGDQRTAGELSRMESGKIFGSGSRAGVAILLLIKKPGDSSGATVYYSDIGDYLSREAKLEILAESRLGNTDWQIIKPNAHGDWINQRSEDFSSLRPLASEVDGVKGMEPVFVLESLGFYTGRDAWCYNASDNRLRHNIQRSVQFYNEKVETFERSGTTGSLQERVGQARRFIGVTPGRFHWRPENYRHIVGGRRYEVAQECFTVGMYRPYFKQRLYCNSDLNSRVRRFPQIYPDTSSRNLGIAITATGASVPFHALMADCIVDSHLNADTMYFPRWCYLPHEEVLRNSDELERVSNINPAALKEYRDSFDDASITEDDLFYHVYGILHSKQYRETFAADLGKSSARIPMPATLADFRAFARAGRELARLHVGYESIEPYDLDIRVVDNWDINEPSAHRVTKMAYRRKGKGMDKTQIRYNAGITLAGIPEEAHEYQLGSRSALDWLVDRYEVKTDSKSGITSDPNDWSIEIGDPSYILDLVRRVTTVSIRTVDIVKSLPELPI